uniref:AMP-binding domain-containing protein n=1 Tax=Macrostomum lignano TaxID=282301 RepID=A0A1I8FQA4_9PLAT
AAMLAKFSSDRAATSSVDGRPPRRRRWRRQSLRYYPADLEATVVRCHPAIVDLARCFACDSLLAVVMELSCRESDALDAVPQATTALLRDHQLGGLRVIVCDPGAIPANGRVRSFGRFCGTVPERRLDCSYVAYNL